MPMRFKNLSLVLYLRGDEKGKGKFDFHKKVSHWSRAVVNNNSRGTLYRTKTEQRN